MKTYIQPQNRIIDLCSDCEILSLSDPDASSYEVTDDYADEEALSSKGNIWGNSGIWKD